LVLFDGTPAPQRGETPTFSLLVPMNELFEEFVARLIRRHARELGFERSSVHVQAKRRRRHLLRDEEGRQRYGLKPDVLISDSDGVTSRILDTKWKILGGEKNKRPSEADIYQLYAYAHRYRCPENILLFPRSKGTERRAFALEGSEAGGRIRIEFLDVSRDLAADRTELLRELRTALHG
jgi:5-methylcytosine-specific restriction enzyme subunit McrC